MSKTCKIAKCDPNCMMVGIRIWDLSLTLLLAAVKPWKGHFPLLGLWCNLSSEDRIQWKLICDFYTKCYRQTTRIFLFLSLLTIFQRFLVSVQHLYFQRAMMTVTVCHQLNSHPLLPSSSDVRQVGRQCSQGKWASPLSQGEVLIFPFHFANYWPKTWPTTQLLPMRYMGKSAGGFEKIFFSE
jgi:hypothetical protein